MGNTIYTIIGTIIVYIDTIYTIIGDTIIGTIQLTVCIMQSALYTF